MSKKTGESRPNMWGGYTHYDEHGHKIGESNPNMWGGYTNYDAKGHKTGESNPNMWGGYSNYDRNGHKTGESNPNMFGGYNYYDDKGHKVGESTPSMFGGYNSHGDGNDSSGSYIGGNSSGQNEGCYIATAVYGSYDCPEVWTLRRFRDYGLRKSWVGRQFVKGYYAVSPKLVLRFGHVNWLCKGIRKVLNGLVKLLRKQGFDDRPYTDK